MNLNENKRHGTTISLWFTCLLFIMSIVACAPSTLSDGGDGGNQPDLIDLDLQFTGFQVNEKDKDERVTLPLPVGKEFNLVIQVTNQSINDYDGIVTYYQSDDNNISTNDTSIGVLTNFSLAGGGSWEATFTPTTPVSAGTYYYGACLSFVNEVNINQVTCTTAFQVMVRELDLGLALTGFQVNEKDKDERVTLPLPVGKEFNLVIQVTNQSINDYDGIVTYYQSDDNNISTNDTSIGVLTNFSLAGGGSWEATFTPTTPSSAGTYYYGACLSFVNEVNINQVTCTTAFQVMVRELDLGLALTGFQINGKNKDEMVSLLVGKDLTMAVQVANQGKNEYTGTVTYYQSGDNNISTNDNSLASTNLFLLTGGGSWEATFTPATPSSAGTYYYGACLSFVNEVNINQVTCTTAFQVMVRELDLGLALTGFQINGKNKDEMVSLLVGKDLTMAVQVANQGKNEYTGTVTYYQSGDNNISTNDNSLASTNLFLLTGGGSWEATFTPATPSSAGTYYYGACLSFVNEGNTNQVTCTTAVQVDIREFLENVFNIDDGNNNNLELARAQSVTTAQVGRTTYLFVAGQSDNGVSVFTVANDGSLINVANVRDDNTLELDGANSVTTAVVEETTYLFTAGEYDSGISVFSVANNGSLSNVYNVSKFDNNNLKLAGIRSVTTAQVEENTYLFATGYDDNGLSVFKVDPHDENFLKNVANVSDNGVLEIEGTVPVTTTVVEGTTYLFTAGYLDNGVSVFSVDSEGRLNNVYNIMDTRGVLRLTGVYSVTTDVVEGTTYLFIAGRGDSGISVFKVNTNGEKFLENVANVGDDEKLELDGANSVTTAQVGGTTYLFTAGLYDSGVSVFKVDPHDEDFLENVANVNDDNTLRLREARSVTTAVVEGTTYLFVAGQYDSGVSVFRVNGE